MCNKDEVDMLKSVPKSRSSTGRRLPHTSQHPEDLEKLKSHVRLCVMRILTERLTRPAVFSEADSALVTEIIVEYLQWMGYNHTLETFRMECRLPEEQTVGLSDHLALLQNNSNDSILPQIFNVVNKYKLHQVTPD